MQTSTKGEGGDCSEEKSKGGATARKEESGQEVDALTQQDMRKQIRDEDRECYWVLMGTIRQRWE